MKKKGIMGEGIVEVFSILLLVGILIVFYVSFKDNVDFSEIKGIKEVVASEKIINDGFITLNNILKTPLEDLTLYEFILLNREDNEKIQKEVGKILDVICKNSLAIIGEEDLDFIKDVCFWELKIKFTNKEILLKAIGDKDEYSESSNFEVNLPDYDDRLVNFKLILYRGFRGGTYG